MANPLCIDTKHGQEQAKFGLDLCLRDHHGRSGEQVNEIDDDQRNRRFLSCVSRISN